MPPVDVMFLIFPYHCIFLYISAPHLTRREGAEVEGSGPPFNFHYICSDSRSFRFRFSYSFSCGCIAIDVLLCALSSIWVLLRFEIYAKYSPSQSSLLLSQPSTQPHSAQIMSKPAFPATFHSFCLPTSRCVSVTVVALCISGCVECPWSGSH